MLPPSDKLAMQTAAAATGNGTPAITADRAALVMQIAGTFVGTVTFEATIDDTNWIAVQVANLNNGAVTTTATAPGLFACMVAGLHAVRARVSAWTSGTITVTGIATSIGAGLTLADIDIAASETVQVEVGGQAPQLDDTDKLAVSLYGKASAEGDSALLSEGGNLKVALYNGGTAASFQATEADARSNALRTLCTTPYAYLFNGTNWDRVRNNVEATLLASAARTVETNSADQVNYNGKALALFIDVTSITSTPSVTPQLEWKDPVSGDYEPIWIAAAAITATGEYVYLFDMGGVGSAGEYDEAVNIRIPRTWRLTVKVADTDSMTYSVAACTML